VSSDQTAPTDVEDDVKAEDAVTGDDQTPGDAPDTEVSAEDATETDASETTETDETDSEADTGARRRLPYAKIGAAVLAVALVASAGLTAWLYFAKYRPDQATGPAVQQQAINAAKDGTVAILSYGPDSLDKDLATAKSHLTGQFLSYYTDFTDQVVRPAVKDKQVKTEAKVLRAAVSDIHPGAADVLVFVNQTTLSKDRPDPSMAASSVLVKMTNIDGKWLISEFNPV
jgi:Mce-associated membrane protein